jgi:hypothetical protein
MNNLTVTRLLLLAAFLCVIGAAVWRVPIWVSVLLLTVVGLLGAWPLR